MKIFWRNAGRWIALVAAMVWLTACQVQLVNPVAGSADAQATIPGPPHIGIDVPVAWGGEVRCSALSCRLVAVEHGAGNVVLYQLNGRQPARLLDRQAVAYHPDSAIWLADDLVAAAVELTGSLDIFRVEDGHLRRIDQIILGITPRDVVRVSDDGQGRYRLLATPYSGEEVAWVDYAPAQPQATKVVRRRWCEAPWHPVRVDHAPGVPGGGVAVACRGAQRVVLALQGDLTGAVRTLAAPKFQQPLAMRQARPSPSGKWLFVAMETGERNFRINMDSGELQWLAFPPTGAVAVLPLSDDLVIWGDDLRLHMQRLDGQGQVLETRYLPVDGLATGLQLQDVDGDGEPDLVAYNASVLSRKKGVNILFGPLWEQALHTWPPQPR